MVLELDFDRSLMGKDHPNGPYEVTRELINNYCTVMGETNPLYTNEDAAKEAGYDAVLAPPALCSLFIRGGQLPDIKLKFGRSRFHAGQMLETLAPIMAGDVLTSLSRLKEVYPKTGRSGTIVFSVWETVFLNQRNEQVAVLQESHVARE